MKNYKMKIIMIQILICLYFSINNFLFSQEFEFNKAGDSKYIEQLKINLKYFNDDIPLLKEKLQSINSFNGDLKEFLIEYEIDTLRVEFLFAKRLEMDDSNTGIEYALTETANDYMKLIDKYYKKLLVLYKKNDSKYIILSQEKWKSYISTDYKLEIIALDYYDEFGTMKFNEIKEWYLNLVKARLYQFSKLIFQYYAKMDG